MTVFTLPFQNLPQRFTIALAGKEYFIECRWNSAPEAGWVFDIGDAITNEVLACNNPLIAGADCLEGLEYLNIQGIIYVLTNGNQNAVPTLDNLGTECNVYFATEVG